jgi:RNA polymerase sigma-70 factor (ECF subfamily)
MNSAKPSDGDHARFAKLVLPHLGDAAECPQASILHYILRVGAAAGHPPRQSVGIGGLADRSGRPWLLTIVRNTAYTWLRKNRPSAILVVEDLEAAEGAQAIVGDPDSETPETALIASVEATQLEAAVAALHTPYRETIVLRDIQGLSYREIGEVTGVPIGTVMSRIARARGKLIASMTKNEVRPHR